MADGMFGMGPQFLQEDIAFGNQMANIPTGRGAVAGMSQFGAGLGRAIGGAMGMEDPRVEQKRRVMEALKQGGVDLNDPQNLYKLGQTMIQMGETEKGMKLLDLAQKAEQNMRLGSSPTDLQKNLQMIADSQGLDIKTPEGFNQAMQILKNYKRGTAEEFALRGDITELNKMAPDVYKTSNNAIRSEANYQQMLNILPNTYTGWGGEFVAGAKNIAESLGFETDVANAELFRSGAIQQALEYVNQTKGAVSDMEMREFQRASSGLGRSEAGNRAILEYAVELARWEQKLAKELARWRQNEGKGQGLSAWQAHFDEWRYRPENQIKIRDKVDAALKSGTPSMATPTAGAVAPQSIDELDAAVEAIIGTSMPMPMAMPEENIAP